MLTRTLRSGAELLPCLSSWQAGSHFRKELLRSKMGVYLSPTRFRRYQKEEMRLAGSSLTLISKEAFPMVDIVEQLVWRI